MRCPREAGIPLSEVQSPGRAEEGMTTQGCLQEVGSMEAPGWWKLSR